MKEKTGAFTEIRCPLCKSKWLFNFRGETPEGNFQLKIDCPRCGPVWVTSDHLKKVLTAEGKI